ncbi:MAG TPA: serine/threonine-protein kinase, partial [Clostridia bacterium]|nr:serine/threonine-protein kinase [Clostridia bacterium]
MPDIDPTVFDPGATVAESGKPVLESDATVLDDGTTLLEAALSDAAGQMDADARENIAIQKGDTILDTYRVESDVIEGGMGSVWRVHHTSWNIDLAMKRPQPKCFSTEKSKADFIHECEAWINLGLHPNIVSCYYVREIFGTPSIFSEWMDGGSLEKAIQKGTIYEGMESAQKERLLDIAIQFARGLHYAHEAGLIHQDVKPDNVLLTKEGEAKVADFGLARARAVLTVLEGERTMSEPSDGGKTMLSPSGGYTPAYCSMEQMDGKELTRRTDIYSWAVSAMEMYIGFRPWANGVVAGLSCAAYFKKARVPMPEALKTLLAQCLESEPEDRPHDFA